MTQCLDADIKRELGINFPQIPKVVRFPSVYQATKGVRWMPWRQESMKDVISCDKLR